jgi:prephenate dehydratase
LSEARVAFLGPEGTFSEEALFAATDRAQLEPVALPTIYECVAAVQDGEVERAFVPIENSLEGSVNATLDALVFEAEEVAIVGEFVHPIRVCLIARPGIPLEQVEPVISHPQASGQCARFLRQRLAHAEVVAAPSTADAVRAVAESSKPWAALGTRLSAELYGAGVLLADVEDRPDNETRFVFLEKQADDPQADRPIRRRPGGAPSGAASYKTSVVLWGLPDVPGALVGVLEEFAARGVNLTKIESRPLKQGLGRYIFFADLEGGAGDEQVAAALAAVGEQVDTLRILGSYPAAAPAR